MIVSEEIDLKFDEAKIMFTSDLKTVKFKVKTHEMEAKRILNEIKNFVRDNTEPLLYRKNHCKMCEFQISCRQKLVEQDSLGLLPRMNDEEITKWNSKGIFTVNQLSYTFKPRKRSKRNKAGTYPYQAPLHALAIRENKVYVYDKIELPETGTKIFVDMEGNSDASFVYLIGILVVSDGKTKNYSLWADKGNNEKDIFEDFYRILRKYEDHHIFYFGKYESKVFKRIDKYLYLKGEKSLLKNSTNILGAIYSRVYFPTYSNGLKELGRYLGFDWSVLNASALQSVVWRKKWNETRDGKLKEKLIQYNLEDCLALHKLTDFLRNIFENSSNESENKKITFVKDMKIERRGRFRNLEAVSKDIEIVNKCAYFEYQRSKVFFRTNKTIKKIKAKKAKEKPTQYKPNKIIDFTCRTCPKCKKKEMVFKTNTFNTKVCLDLKTFSYGIKRWVTLYRTPVYFCFKCKKSFRAKKFDALRFYLHRNIIPHDFSHQRGYGHTLLSWTIYQNLVNRITFRNIENNLKDYFGLEIKYNKLHYFKRFASQHYKSTYQKILDNLVQGSLIHADETRVKFRHSKGYVWVLTNMGNVLYIYKPTRESEFLQDMLKGFNGVLISDFYPGYDSLDCKQQKCLIHLIRDLNDSLLKNPNDEELRSIVISFGEMMREVIETIDKYGLKKRFMRKHKIQVEKFFKKLSKQPFYSETAEKIRKRLIKSQKNLFLFLNYDDVPWNNNNAEHAIKSFAIYRKLMKKTITEKGLEAHLILLSIQQTCKYKGINFLKFLLSKENDIEKFNQKS